MAVQSPIPPMDYDQHWSESLDTYRSHPTSRHRRRFVLRSLERAPLGPGAFVFDYGCGTGLTLRQIQDRFELGASQLGGCDLSEVAVATAQRDFPGGHFTTERFPVLDRLIDVAVCTEVIEHTPDFERILRWLRTNIRAGGTLVLSTPHSPMEAPDEFYGHTQHFALGDLTMLLEQNGFKIDVARRWGFPFFTLQRLLTRAQFERVRRGFMEGKMTFKKKAAFGAAYWLYILHDWIPFGPQIFIRAHV